MNTYVLIQTNLTLFRVIREVSSWRNPRETEEPSPLLAFLSVCMRFVYLHSTCRYLTTPNHRSIDPRKERYTDACLDIPPYTYIRKYVYVLAMHIHGCPSPCRDTDSYACGYVGGKAELVSLEVHIRVYAYPCMPPEFVCLHVYRAELPSLPHGGRQAQVGNYTRKRVACRYILLELKRSRTNGWVDVQRALKTKRGT